ncbi:MAG: Ppx/GppA family phosphatase [Myxococcales bacterium]|nr:Ppx/GppA family phosphatase [Myxococcales bacterium]
MRVATVDIGTNSVLLLIADVRDGDLYAIVERATITRLGEGVDSTGSLSRGARERTLACIADYANQITLHRADFIAAVGTSAMRDATGGDALSDEVEAILGARPEIVSGEREARLTFDGALIGLEPTGLLAVFDIGGGSTEIIVGARVGRGAGTLSRAVSLDIGSVRLTERHVRSDPPRAVELQAIRRDIRVALRAAPKLDGRPLVGVAGTMTTLAAYCHGVVPYDPRRVHGAVLGREALSDAALALAAMPLADRRRAAGIEPQRADVIVAGALIADEICELAKAARVLVSDRGVRWGLALELVSAHGKS